MFIIEIKHKEYKQKELTKAAFMQHAMKTGNSMVWWYTKTEQHFLGKTHHEHRNRTTI